MKRLLLFVFAIVFGTTAYGQEEAYCLPRPQNFVRPEILATQPSRRTSMAVQSLPRSTVDRPDDFSGYQIQILDVVPSDGPDTHVDENGVLATSIAAMDNWFLVKSGGYNLRIDTYKGKYDIPHVVLDKTTAEIATSDRGPGIIEDFLRSHGFFLVVSKGLFAQEQAMLPVLRAIDQDQ